MANRKTRSQRFGRGIISVIPFALLFSTLSAQAQKEPVYTLKLKFLTGDISRYQTIAEIITRLPSQGQKNAGTSSFAVNLTQQMRVKRSLSGGGGEISVETLSGQLLQNGEPRPITNPKPVRIVYDSRGNITGFKASPNVPGDSFAGVIGSGALGMLRVYLPPNPVKIGEEWSQPVEIPGLTWAGKGVAKAKLIRLEKVGRFQTVRIRAAFSLPLNIYINATLQPVNDKKLATAVLTGTLYMNFDNNFALQEGKIIKSGGSGTANVHFSALPTAKGVPPKRISNGLENAKMTMEMHVGSNLLE